MNQRPHLQCSALRFTGLAITGVALFVCAFGAMGFARIHADEKKVSAIYVVLHKDNGADAEDMTTTVIREIFLKQRASFPNNKDAEPVNQKDDSAARKLFLSKVLKMTEAELTKHWDKEKVRSGKTKPKECTGDDKTFAKVSRSTEAIGYISKKYYDDLSAEDKALLKIVETVEE